MKRWLPIVAVAFLVAGCDNSSDEPPATPQGSEASSTGTSSPDDKLVTGPRGSAETLPPVEVPKASGDSGRDSAATKPKEELTKQEEKQAMPEAGQANNHSSEALSKPGAGGDSASGGTTSGAASGSTQLAQSASSGSGSGAAAAGAAAAGAAGGAAGGSAQPVSQEQALALMKKHNCISCHAVDKKLVGPSYKDVAAKYKGDASAETKLIDKVVKGGSGVWGPVPMPPHPNVPKEDIKAIVDWILAGAS